jgi:DNA polymerase I-like protein with 3'-5' exonuclease and polymerase domains
VSIQQAFENESKVREIMHRQALNGVQFNVPKAHYLIYSIKLDTDGLEGGMKDYLGLVTIKPYTVPVNRPFLKSGSYSAACTEWMGDECTQVWGPFSRVAIRAVNMNKKLELIAALIKLGWKPKSFTKKTHQPMMVVDKSPCPSLLALKGGVGKEISLYFQLKQRSSQITGLLKHIRKDGRISAKATTIGTPTYRMRHKVVVNIPRVSSLLGKEMRSLFIAGGGNVLVGHDAKGLELRMLAHYMGDPLYRDEVLSGDVHITNMKAAGLPDKDTAKTFIYAFLYGAGNAKIGRIIGKGFNAGAKMRKKFIRSLPKLQKLLERCEKAAGRGFIVGLDGRKVILRRGFDGKVQDHKVVNTLLQTAGAVIMKYSIVLLDKAVKDANLRVKKVIDMHDEGQAEVHPDDVEEYSKLARWSIVQAGVDLGLKIELDADVKVGKTWAHTH